MLNRCAIGDREGARLHLESIKRILAQEAPGFAD